MGNETSVPSVPSCSNPSPASHALSELLRGVYRLEVVAGIVENRLLKRRIKLENWYRDHTIIARADFERVIPPDAMLPIAPVQQTTVQNE